VSDDTHTVREEIWESLADGGYRHAFVDSNISTTIAAQIRAMREARGWTQGELAQRAGMAQARISVMENPSYDKFSLSTLKRLRAAFDVALVVRFVPYSDVVNWTSTLTPGMLAPVSYSADTLKPIAPPAAAGMGLPSAAEALRRGPIQNDGIGSAPIINLAEARERRLQERYRQLPDDASLGAAIAQ